MSTGTVLLEARNIEKTYNSVMRVDAPLRFRLSYALFGWLGAFKDSRRLWEPRAVVRGVDLEVYEDEILAITGKSGAGKSTLLHLLGTFDTPSRGEIRFRGQDVTEMTAQQLSDFRNTHIGYVFQFYHLYKDLTAIENVLLPAMVASDYGAREAQLRERALELLNDVGLSHRFEHRPNQLSGGEQQRVAIARALLLEPELLLCDEPTGNLDVETGEQILELLFRLREKERRSYVIVTHDLEVAARADRHVRMRDGVIVEADELAVGSSVAPGAVNPSEGGEAKSKQGDA